MVKKAEFSVPRVADEDTERALRELIDQMEDRLGEFPPFGRILPDVLLDTTEVQLRHGLGQKPQGWIIVDRDSNVHIYRSSKSTDRSLYLKATASVVASIWVF